MRPTRWLLSAALLLTTSLPALADMKIERTMRELQIRYHYLWKLDQAQDFNGFAPARAPYLAWTPGYGGVAPHYPPDGFYGDLSQDPDLGVIVVQRMLDLFANNQTRIYDRFLNVPSPELTGVPSGTVNSLLFAKEYFQPSPGLLAASGEAVRVERANYGRLNQALYETLLTFRYILASTAVVANTGDGTFPLGAMIQESGWVSNGTRCGDLATAMGTAWETSTPVHVFEPGPQPRLWEDWEWNHTTHSGQGRVGRTSGLLQVSAPAYPESLIHFHAACEVMAWPVSGPSQPGPAYGLDLSGNYKHFGEPSAGGRAVRSKELPGDKPSPRCHQHPPDNFCPLSYNECHAGWKVTAHCAVLDVTFTAESDDTNPCCSDCPPGTSTLKAGSLYAYFSLGVTCHGKNAGYVLLHAKGAAHDLGDPKWLRYNVYQTDGAFADTTTTDCYGTIRQIITHEVVLNVDYDPQNPDTYYLRFYDPDAQTGQKESIDELYTRRQVVSGAPFKTVTVQGIREPNSDGPITEMHITEDSAGNLRRHRFTHGVAPGGLAGWTYERPADLGYEARMSNDESPATEEFRIMDADFTTRHFERTVREMKPWGEEIVERQVGQDPSGRVTTWEFYEDPRDGDNFGHVKTIVHPGGRWERFPEYDDSGRLRKHVQQWLDNDPGTADSANRVTTYTYTSTLITIRERLLDKLVAKRYLRFDGPEGYRAHEVVIVPDDANPPNEVKLISKSWRDMALDHSSTFGMTTKIIRPDGTGSRSLVASGSFPVDPDDPQSPTIDGIRLTTEAGVWSTDQEPVLTVHSTDRAVRDGAGHPVWRTRHEIDDSDSRKPVQVIVSKELHDDPDAFGRPQKVSFLGLDVNNQPLVEENHYGCCGVEYRKGRDGTQTDYLLDDLRRQYGSTTGGITVWSVLDAAGNARRTHRQHSGGAQLLENADFDDTGRKTRSSDALNNETDYSSEFVGLPGTVPHRVTTVRNPDDSTVIDTYHADGQLLERGGTAAFPVRYEYAVESDGAINALVTKEIRLGNSGGTTEWVKSYRDMAGRVYRRVFSNQGEQAQGGAETMHYNALGQLEKQVDADGIITLFEYNHLGEQEFTILDCDGTAGRQDLGSDRITRTFHSVLSADHAKRGVAVHRTETHVWKDGSSKGVLMERADQSVDGLQSWTERHWEDASNHPVVTSSESRTEYDPVNQQVTETRTAPDGTKTVTVTEHGKRISVTRLDSTDQPVMGMTFHYDDFGRLWKSVDARNGATEYGYDLANRQTTVTTPAPGDGSGRQVTEQFLDDLGRPWAVLLPDGEVQMNEYHDNGLLKLAYGARTYPVSYEYDSQGRLKTMTTWTDFDESPGHQGSTGAAETTWDYDSGRGWLRQKRDATNKGPDYAYTAGGRLKTRTWARERDLGGRIVTTYTYGFDDDLLTDNQHEGLVGISYNDGITPAVARTYDRQGRLQAVTRNGVTTTLGYNGAGLATAESHEGGSLTGLSVARTFDTSLRLDTLTGFSEDSPLQAADYDFDSTGRLWAVTSDSDVVKYAYHDNSDLVHTVTFNQGTSTPQLVTSRTFDRLNRLQTISSAPTGASLPLSYTYAYNQANQRKRSTLADGTFWVYTYDDLGQVTSGRRCWADGTPVAGQQFEYGFDEIGNRTTTGGRDSAVSTYTMRPNGLNQYESRKVAGAVDVLGNANATAAVTVDGVSTDRRGEYFHRAVPVDNGGDNGERYPAISVAAAQGGSQASQTTKAFVPAATEEFVHDYDGNLRRDGRWLYEWDAENRLIEMRRDYADPAGAQWKLTFEYDWHGRRIRKTVYQGDGEEPPTWNKQADTIFLYDGWNLVAELATNGQTPPAFTRTRTYVWGDDLSGSMQGAGGVGGLLKVNDGDTGSSAFVAYDGNGNVMGLTDATDGTLGARYDYGPFGEPLRATGPQAANPFRFSTKYCDAETGLYYYGFRYYDPITGRWCSQDPIEELGGMNLYGLLNNSPLADVDANGLVSLEKLLSIMALLRQTLDLSVNCRCPKETAYLRCVLEELGEMYGKTGFDEVVREALSQASAWKATVKNATGMDSMKANALERALNVLANLAAGKAKALNDARKCYNGCISSVTDPIATAADLYNGDAVVAAMEFFERASDAAIPLKPIQQWISFYKDAYTSATKALDRVGLNGLERALNDALQEGDCEALFDSLSRSGGAPSAIRLKCFKLLK